MLTTSEQVNEIAAALAKAQGAMDNASKDRVNPAFKSKYADLASVRDAVNGPMSANGIAVLQAAATTADGITVETRLIHSTGQWLASTMGAVPKGYDAQSIGSCVTYLRRYGLMAMAGIAPEDDDGNAASGRQDAPAWQGRRDEPRQESRQEERRPEPRQEPAREFVPAPPKKWSDPDRKRFCEDVKKIGLNYITVAALCESLGRPRPSAMDATQRSGLLHWLMQPAGVAATKAFLNPPDVANDHR